MLLIVIHLAIILSVIYNCIVSVNGAFDIAIIITT